MGVIKEFSTGYHSRNGGGDLIITDCDLAIIDVRHVDVPEVAKVERHRQSGQATGTDRANRSAR